MISLRSFLFIILTMCFEVLWASTSTAALNYGYDVVERSKIDKNIESAPQTNNYDDDSNLRYCYSESWSSYLQKRTQVGSFFTFIDNFAVPNKAVIGKVDDLNAPGAIKPGENTLLKHLPNQGNPKANWKQNSSVLRQEMNKGKPIRDASVKPRNIGDSRAR